MSAHTKGPWTAEFVEYGAEVTDDLCILGPTPGFRNVATISRCYQGDRVRDMEQANARLIAAAPLLLDALEQVTDALAQRLGTNAAEWADVSRARAASAAARGQA